MSLFENTIQTTDVKFEDLVGEGKKYKTQDDAAKAIAEKDRFIQQLQSENAEMRKTVTSVDRSQEILDRLEALKKTEPTAVNEPVTPIVERVVEKQGITTEDIEKLLAERERKAQQKRNIETVKQELVKKFGPQYTETLKSLAVSIGATPEYLEGIAAQSPQAFLRLVAPETSQGSPFTPPSSVTPDRGFQPTAGPHQKASYYKKLQAENRAEYFKPSTQNQMYRDAMALKEEFYDVTL